MKRSIFFLFIFISISLLAHKKDTLYIKPFDKNVELKGYLKRNHLSLLNGNRRSDNFRLFQPNNPVDIGIGLTLRNTILSVSYGYGFDFMKDEEKGQTKIFDFQIHNYSRKFILDLFIYSEI